MAIEALKQLLVGACMGEDKYKLFFVLFPDQKPVGLQMTFHEAFVFATKLVRLVFCGEFPFLFKYPGGSFEDFNIEAPIHTSFQGFFETVGEYQTVHRYSIIWFTISSTLSAL